jgi:hypothetical protein
MNVDYERPGIQARGVIQNKSVWGANGNQALKLYEGWVKMTTRNGLFAQIGRIALSYDDERIIGLQVCMQYHLSLSGYSHKTQ